MATDVDSLAAGLEGHVVKLGNWSQGITKNMENPHKFLGAPDFAIVDRVAKALLNIHYSFA
jgi:hypothetical protein